MPETTNQSIKQNTQQEKPDPKVKIFFYGSIGLIVLAALGVIGAISFLMFRPTPNTPPTRQAPINEPKILQLSDTTTDQVDLSQVAPDLLVTKGTKRQKATHPSITFIDPQIGPSDAPITIIEFSDFGCPYCAQVQTTLNKLFEKYENKIKLVWKNLPVNIGSQKAAEASLCAKDQNKFWEYHGLLFANQVDLSNDALITYAKELKLNTNTFTSCLQSGKMKPRVDKSLLEASDLAIDSTPHFYINNQEISGAADLDEFERIIEIELSK